MVKILQTKKMIRCSCESCGMQVHNIIEGKGVVTSAGVLDFVGIRCKNCLKIIVCSPVPFPRKNWGRLLTEEIQRELDANS